MPRRSPASSVEAPPRVGWYVALSALGLLAAGGSTWVHYRLLNDPTYTSSFCDISSTLSCTEAYTSRYGSVGGVPLALIGLLYFVFVLGLIALCRRSTTAGPNVPGYVFAVSTLGLAAVLYFAYASFFVLKAVCLLCVGTYIAIIGLFLFSGARTAFPMTSLPGRIRRDVGTLLRSPAALSSAVAFVVIAVAATRFFPGQPVSAQAAASPQQAQPAAPAATAQSAIQQLEQWLSQQPRTPIMAPSDGAAVVIVKFNDYQCPPCGQTYLEYKPVLAKYQQEQPGKVKLIMRDFPLEPECNSFVPNGLHPAACEAAVSVRLSREKGRAEALEEWLFANQSSLTPASVREAARTVGAVADLDARYPATLELVRGDVAQGGQLGVRGTPTFFMNGIRLPGLRAEFFDAAIAWELRKVGQGR